MKGFIVNAVIDGMFEICSVRGGWMAWRETGPHLVHIRKTRDEAITAGRKTISTWIMNNGRRPEPVRSEDNERPAKAA